MTKISLKDIMFGCYGSVVIALAYLLFFEISGKGFLAALPGTICIGFCIGIVVSQIFNKDLE